MRDGSAHLILWAALLSAFRASVTARAQNGRSLGNCSALKGIELRRCLASTRRNEVTVLDAYGIPEKCEGLKDIEGCIVEYSKIESILAQHNLDSVPKDCEGTDSNSIEACLTEWDLTQIILGLSNTKIPPECEGLLQQENKLKKCLQEHTLSPSSYPTTVPTMTTKSPTKSPTLQSIQSPTQPSSDSTLFTTSSLGTNEVVLDIGTFLMSLTTYSQTSREIITSEVGLLTSEHELAAARQHLREVYEDAFHIPIITVDLEFVDSGTTALSKSHNIQHSTFFGNATFLEEASHLLPTLTQLESETLKAFSGTSKEAFIEKYHFLATGVPSSFGVKDRYDVSVRKLDTVEESNTAAAAQESRGRNKTTKDSSTGPSVMFIGLMIMFASVSIVTLAFGLAVLIRKRQLDGVPSEQTLHDDCMLELVDVIGSDVDSDVSISPLQLLEGDDCSGENISHLGIDLSHCDTDDEDQTNVSESEVCSSTWNNDSKRQNTILY